MPGEASAKKHEFIGVCILIIAVLLLLCLLSYNPHDSSLNALSLKPSIDNKIGKIGAYASDFLFQTFGFPAFLLLAPLLIMSWKFTFGRQVSAPYLRAFGFILLLASLAAGLQLLPLSLPDVNFMPGGVTGVLIVRYSSSEPEPNRHRYRCCRSPDIGYIGVDHPFA